MVNLTEALDIFEDNLVDIRKACVLNVLEIQKENEPYEEPDMLKPFTVENIWLWVRWHTVERKTEHYIRTIKRIDAMKAPKSIGNVTDDDIARAKEVPIEDLYDGRLFRNTGLCPLHNERTPSFTINKDKNTWRCFGCNEYGDSIDLVMKRDGLDFIEAVKKLSPLHL